MTGTDMVKAILAASQANNSKKEGKNDMMTKEFYEQLKEASEIARAQHKAAKAAFSQALKAQHEAEDAARAAIMETIKASDHPMTSTELAAASIFSAQRIGCILFNGSHYPDWTEDMNGRLFSFIFRPRETGLVQEKKTVTRRFAEIGEDGEVIPGGAVKSFTKKINTWKWVED